MTEEDVFGMEPDRRQIRAGAYYVKASHFWVGLALVLSVLGVTPFAITKWVLQQTIEEHVRLAIDKHNGQQDAHRIAFEKLLDKQSASDQAIVIQLVDINTRLSRIEGALSTGRK